MTTISELRDLELRFDGPIPAQLRDDRAIRQRIGSVMLNMDLWENYRKHAARPGIDLATRERHLACAAWHFDAMERAAGWFFQEAA